MAQNAHSKKEDLNEATNMYSASDTEFLHEADAFIEEHWEEIVREIGALVSVPSVVDFSCATPQDPSGPKAHEGLAAAVDLAERLGFEAWDDAGEIGIADLPGMLHTIRKNKKGQRSGATGLFGQSCITLRHGKWIGISHQHVLAYSPKIISCNEASALS